MNSKYDDIIDLPHHVSTNRKQMSRINRAAQFAPFAALTGYETSIKESSRLTESRIELDKYSKLYLNEKIRLINIHIKDKPMVSITYFKPDESKAGGKYIEISDRVTQVDEYNLLLIIDNKTKIPMSEIIEINSEIFDKIF